MADLGAELVEKSWVRRAWRVTVPQYEHVVRYDGRGMGYETLYVNDEIALRREGLGSMSRVYGFQLDEHRRARLTVTLPWWGELWVFADLDYVRLEIDGRVVYEEGRLKKSKVPVLSDLDGV